MLNFWHRAPSSLLGIDISPCSVKALELTKSDKGFHVENFAITQLASGTVSEHIVKNPTALTQAMLQLVNKIKPARKYVAIAIPDSLAITKIIQLDALLSENDIEEQVAIEAEKYIPYPLQEINLDFTIVGPASQSKQHLDILLAATRTETIMPIIGALREVNLHVKVVDIQAYAIERASQLLKHQLPQQGLHKIVAIVDIGPTALHLTILDNFKSIYSREESLASQTLQSNNTDVYHITQNKENLTRLYNHSATDNIKTASAFCSKRLISHLRRALQLFFSTSQYNEIEAIVLTGNMAKTPDLDKIITEQFKVHSTIANPLANMTIAPHVDTTMLMAEACSLLTCCGLALRRFDNAYD